MAPLATAASRSRRANASGLSPGRSTTSSIRACFTSARNRKSCSTVDSVMGRNVRPPRTCFGAITRSG